MNDAEKAATARMWLRSLYNAQRKNSGTSPRIERKTAVWSGMCDYLLRGEPEAEGFEPLNF